MNPMTRRRVARRRLIAEWAARANRWFGAEAPGTEAWGPGAEQVAREDSASAPPARRLPFELLDAPPVEAAHLPSNGDTASRAPAASAEAAPGIPSLANPAEPAVTAEPAALAAPADAVGESPAAETTSVDPDSAEAHFNLGLATSRRGRWREAVTHLRRAIELDGGRAAAYFYLGEALNHVDDLPGALQAYQRSVELKPSNPKALYGMGIVLDRMNRPDDATPLYRRSRECRSNSNADHSGGSA